MKQNYTLVILTMENTSSDWIAFEIEFDIEKLSLQKMFNYLYR